MNRTRTTAAVAAGVLGVTLLTGCGLDDSDSCRTPQQQVMFLGTDHHYHYGSPTGRIVPATQVPKSAQKVSGYKPPSAKVAPPPKVDLKKPGTSSGGTVKQPSAPKPAPAPRPAAPAPRR